MHTHRMLNVYYFLFSSIKMLVEFFLIYGILNICFTLFDFRSLLTFLYFWGRYFKTNIGPMKEVDCKWNVALLLFKAGTS